MIRTIHLHGRLKKEFGPKFAFDVETAAEALKALNCAFPGRFVSALRDGSYKLVRGDKRTGMALDLQLVQSLRLGRADLHIIPVATGAASARSKGTAKTIVGAALVGAAIFASGGTLAAPLAGLSTSIPGIGISYGAIASIGLGLALSGVAQLLTSAEQRSSDSAKDASFAISGPTNSAEQGAGVQLIFGRTMVPTVTIQFDADIENIGAYQA